MKIPLLVIALLFAAPATANAIAEDDTGWNCATMGNSVCGPGVRPPTWPAYCDDVRLYPSGSTAWIDIRTAGPCRDESE